MLPILIAFVSSASAANTLYCRKPIALGQACTQNNECVTGAFCNYSTKKCQTLPVTGQACGNQVSCASGLGCDASGKCVAVNGAGGVCLAGEFGQYLCKSGLVCYSGVCSTLKTAVNSPCSDFEYICASGLGCSFATANSVCVTQVGLGGACSKNECKSGFFCNNNKCAALLSAGSGCNAPWACQAGLNCMWNTNVITKFINPSTCQTTPTVEGKPCTDACGNGLVCRV